MVHHFNKWQSLIFRYQASPTDPESHLQMSTCSDECHPQIQLILQASHQTLWSLMVYSCAKPSFDQTCWTAYRWNPHGGCLNYSIFWGCPTLDSWPGCLQWDSQDVETWPLPGRAALPGTWSRQFVLLVWWWSGYPWTLLADSWAWVLHLDEIPCSDVWPDEHFALFLQQCHDHILSLCSHWINPLVSAARFKNCIADAVSLVTFLASGTQLTMLVWVKPTVLDPLVITLEENVAIMDSDMDPPEDEVNASLVDYLQESQDPDEENADDGQQVDILHAMLIWEVPLVCLLISFAHKFAYSTRISLLILRPPMLHGHLSLRAYLLDEFDCPKMVSSTWYLRLLTLSFSKLPLPTLTTSASMDAFHFSFHPFPLTARILL